LKHRIIVLGLILAAAGLGGCSGPLLPEGGFKTPQFFSRQDWGSSGKSIEGEFSSSAPVAPEEMIDAGGACAGGLAQAPATPEAALATSSGEPIEVQAAPTVAGGIALGMTECDVVRRAGRAGNVQISADPNNDRTVVLNYQTGPWPGIYRFSLGRLKEVERVEAPPPPPKSVKKKAAKPKSASR
jgi:hypothetical protein